MKTIFIGDVFLSLNKMVLERFLQETHHRNYFKERFKHASKNDIRLPKLKITDDIISFMIWFKDRSGNEHCLIFDGTIFLNSIKINMISFQGSSEERTLNTTEYQSYIEILKELTKLDEKGGFIHLSANDEPLRIKNGEVEKFHTLLSELFNKIPKEEQKETELLYQWLLDCHKK